jgi:hypothetical protein
MRSFRLFLTALLLAASLPSAAQTAGRVLLAVGDVAASRGGRTISLATGTAIESGDQIRTGQASSVQIRFLDGAIVSLKPQTIFAVDEYRFDGQDDGAAKALFNLVAGGMRTVTGLIGKINQRNYAMRTPTATVGIRGSAFDGAVCSADNPCSSGGSPAPNGAYLRVWDKGIYHENSSGRHDWDRGDIVHIPDANSGGVRLLQVPEFLAHQLTERSRNAGRGGSDSTPRSGAATVAADGRSTESPPAPVVIPFVATETTTSSGTLSVLSGVGKATGFIATYTLAGGGFDVVQDCGNSPPCSSNEVTSSKFSGNQLQAYSGNSLATLNATGATLSNTQTVSLSDGSTLTVYRLSGPISGTTTSGSAFSNPGGFLVGTTDSSFAGLNAGLPTSGNFSFGVGAGNSGGLMVDAAGNTATVTMVGSFNAVSRSASFNLQGSFTNVSGFGAAAISASGGGTVLAGKTELSGASVSYSCTGSGCQFVSGSGNADVRFLTNGSRIPAMVANGGLFNATKNGASGNTVIFIGAAKCTTGVC